MSDATDWRLALKIYMDIVLENEGITFLWSHPEPSDPPILTAIQEVEAEVMAEWKVRQAAWAECHRTGKNQPPTYDPLHRHG